jgi:prepilin-type N-terminal cleavage/methylation domain-containing protein/uncharacterized delta-60 repeat protein
MSNTGGKLKLSKGFTIVELLVVIVVIGVLAAITVIGYVGVSQRAAAATLQTDLKSASTQLEMYRAENDAYPDPDGAQTEQDFIAALPKSDGTSYTYIASSDGSTYGLMAVGTDIPDTPYYITSDSGAVAEGYLPAYSFAKATGGDGSEYIMGSVRGSDGGYVVTGWTNSYGAGGIDMFLAKYSSDGTMVWFKTWGGSGSDFGNSITLAGDGGYAITGYTTSYGSGNNDMFLARYSSDGNLSWSKTWGGSYSDIGNSITSTGDGGFAVTGETRSYGTSTTYSDTFIAKYASDGALSWSKTWGGSASNERGYSIIQTADDGYAVAGDARSYGAGASDVALLKYDSNGALTWNKTWGGSGDDFAYSVAQTADGGYAVTGNTTSYGSGSLDLTLVKYSSAGALSWNKVLGGSGSESGKSLLQISDGSYVISGSTSSFGAGNSDALMSKFDEGGNLTWSKTWGGTNPDSANSIVRGDDGGYMVSGTTTSYSNGDNEALLLKYNNEDAITGCPGTMCKDWSSAVVITPSVSLGTPSATVSTPSATVTSPSATTATQTTVNQVFVSAQK